MTGRRAGLKGRTDPAPAGVDGVLVVDKPQGPTSHDVVDRVRRVLGTRRVGHMGTLDPFATGVLPLCVGKATRLARFLAEGDKAYRARVRFGFATTTDDLTGEPLGPPRPVRLDPGALESARRALVGPLLQVPPAYSAKRVGGRRLYELAREGKAVAPEASAVTVHALTFTEVGESELFLEVVCSGGTYIRALARDLGEALGLGGHLTELRRTRSGAFSLAEASPLDALEATARERLLPLSALLSDLPAVRVGPEGGEAWRHGRDLDPGLLVSEWPEAPAARLRVLDGAGALLGLGVPKPRPTPGPGMVLHPEVVL